MKKSLIYRYLGTNGIIESPVLLEDTYFVRMIRLVADEKHILTNGEVEVSATTIPEGDLDKWSEIEVKGQD